MIGEISDSRITSRPCLDPGCLQVQSELARPPMLAGSCEHHACRRKVMLPAAIVEAERGTLTSQRAMLVLSVAGGAWTFLG